MTEHQFLCLLALALRERDSAALGAAWDVLLEWDYDEEAAAKLLEPLDELVERAGRMGRGDRTGWLRLTGDCLHRLDLIMVQVVNRRCRQTGEVPRYFEVWKRPE